MHNFKEIEEETLKFWKAKKIYERSKKQNAKGKKFYMMDGPPYATGHIHMGTALNKISKDIAMRSRRMQGFDVFDRAGYDTHGVPIEFQIEKEIGSKSKQDIEKYGVKKFIEKCKDFATEYIDVMNKEFENLGVWMDFDNPYLTLDNEYIEKIWETFKFADKKDLLYLGKYPVHLCPRCETAVAYNEIEYAKQDDNSIFVKFPLVDKKNTFLIIWTTTPWTLPGNTGVMAHPDFIYQEIELSSGERWILAKDLVQKILSKLKLEFNVKKEFKGKEMNGWKYINPLSKNLKLKLKIAYTVVLSGRYVTIEDGTGLVHCAPGHGKEDYEIGKENNLDMPSPVSINGNLTEEAGKYAGKKARIVDEEIISDLEKDNYLILKEKYNHDYPFCWRCKSALLMVSQPQWFLKISEIQKKLLKENENTVWLPSWMKLRMNAWLEGISDWPVSRKRYWGTPLPIWVCDKCNEKIVVGSVQELEKRSKKKIKDVHKPEIDNITWKCKCSGNFKRVSDVLDVWFDSGVSSWAALNEKEFKKFWPADLNLEGKDQIRGWWNSQFILSEIRFDKKPFENISVHGLVMDLGKRKMSKSLGNIISPQDIINKYSRDYLRYYFAKISRGEDFAFDEKEFSDIQKVITVLLNVNNFVNQLEKGKKKTKQEENKSSSTSPIEDRWIISKLNSLTKEITNYYNNYRFFDVISAFERFLVFDLSRTYIQIIRDRTNETKEVLEEIRHDLLKLISPVIPFMAENIWQSLKEKKIVKEESIHLSSFPKANEKKIDEKLENEFQNALKIIESGLKERDNAKIGLKWPLAKAKISFDKEIRKELQEIIARQLNIKKIEMKKGDLKVELDLKMTPELEAEGFARELARNIQSERKKAGLVKEDLIEIEIISDLKGVFESQKEFLKDRVNAKTISLSLSNNRYDYSSRVKIKEKDIDIKFNKISSIK